MSTGYVVSRARKNSLTGTRHTAYAYPDGSKSPVSIGTFDYESDALKAIQLGNLTGTFPTPGRTSTPKKSAALTLEEYCTTVYFPGIKQPNTLKNYKSIFTNHILPHLGMVSVHELNRDRVTRLLKAVEQAGGTPDRLNRVRQTLSTALAPLVIDGTLAVNPCTGIKTHANPHKAQRAVMPDEVKDIIAKLPSIPTQLFARTIIETGMRFGETTELRPRDIDWRTGTIHLERAVADVGVDYHPDKAGRFYIKDTKGKRARITSVTLTLLADLKEHCEANSIGPDDLIFGVRLVAPHYQQSVRIPEIDLESMDLGFTEPNDKGRAYRHGTNTAYVLGACRCEWCRAAARQYSRTMRAKKAKKPRSNRGKNVTGHLPNDVWSAMWNEAVKVAVVPIAPGTHDLRHAHATWLLKNGVDLHTVMRRLGHANIATTEVYLHDLKDMESGAANVIGDLMAG